MNPNSLLESAKEALFGAAAYRQVLVQQVAAAMQGEVSQTMEMQENISPNVAASSSAQLDLIPPTPMGTAPMQAAAASVAAEKTLPRKEWSSLTLSQGLLQLLC